MKRISELAGLIAGLALFLGAMLAAQAYIGHEGLALRADLTFSDE